MTKWEVQYPHSITNPNLWSKEEPTSNECKTQYVCIFHFIFYFSIFRTQNEAYRNEVSSTKKEGEKGGEMIISWYDERRGK
jgi:hypothetical protein